MTFAVDTAPGGGGALVVDRAGCLGAAEDLMQRIDIANLRAAWVVPAQPLRVGEGGQDAFGGLFGRGGKFKVIVHGLGHLVLTVQTEDQRRLG